MAAKILFFLSVLHFCFSLPQQGKWTFEFDMANMIKLTTDGLIYLPVYKTVYNNSFVSVQIDCGDAHDCPLNIDWLFRYTDCFQEYSMIDEVITLEKLLVQDNGNLYNFVRGIFDKPESKSVEYPYQEAKFQRARNITNPVNCGDPLPDESDCPYTVKKVYALDENGQFVNESSPNAEEKTTPKPTKKDNLKAKKDAKKSKREVTPSSTPKSETKSTNPVPTTKSTTAKSTTIQSTTTKPPTTPPTTPTAKKTDKPKGKTVPTTTTAATSTKKLVKMQSRTDPHVCKSWQDGNYLFILLIQSKYPEEIKAGVKVTVTITMHSKDGYLSAVDWPLLVFYGVMCGVYVTLGFIWLVLMICNWADILRIQFWIGAVILLGMIEKAVFYAEYQSINSTGMSVQHAIVAAELVSCLKRALARMLVIIVSLGFGIVKPRLGPMLHRVLGAGALYFILGSIEGCLRVLTPKGDPSKSALLASIPLAVLDAGICWWVFSSLLQTTRTLRLRRNVVKLSLYRHFTNTLIFAVVASVAFMIWVIKMHRLDSCLEDWGELWLDDAYWHILFSVILVVIVVLWRPTINNQRYAFSPLMDAADEEAEEPMMNDAFDGMKMRGLNQGNVKPTKEPQSKVEEDLKWIEENIPATVADTALPSLMDSDEEIMTTKFEMSKME